MTEVYLLTNELVDQFDDTNFVSSYAMYYENLLKNQHMLLYAREREVVNLREQLKQKETETEVNVQFQMCEQAHNLLLGKKSNIRNSNIQNIVIPSIHVCKVCSDSFSITSVPSIPSTSLLFSTLIASPSFTYPSFIFLYRSNRTKS